MAVRIVARSVRLLTALLHRASGCAQHKTRRRSATITLAGAGVFDGMDAGTSTEERDKAVSERGSEDDAPTISMAERPTDVDDPCVARDGDMTPDTCPNPP